MRMNLTHQFLIAMPSLRNDTFYGTMTYLLEHNQQGAMGVVINQPMQMTMERVMEQMDISVDPVAEILGNTPVFRGGPVDHQRGLLLHNGGDAWDATVKISEQWWVTSSRDILEDIALQRGPEQFLFVLGYAGWSSGQLEQEIANNHWLHCDPDPNLIFSAPPEQRRERGMEHFGINYQQLSTHQGHA